MEGLSPEHPGAGPAAEGAGVVFWRPAKAVFEEPALAGSVCLSGASTGSGFNLTFICFLYRMRRNLCR